MERPMELPDPAKILAANGANDDDEEAANLATALDRFEEKFWPLYERRGYSRDTALLSYSLGLFSPDAIMFVGDDSES